MEKVVRLTDSVLMKVIKKIIKEDVENDDEKILSYIKTKTKGLKRETYGRGSAGWTNKEGEEVFQYHNRFFIINHSIFEDIMEEFGTSENKVKKIFSHFLDKKFPNLKYYDITSGYFPKF
jgi:hypothetical protein